LKYSPEDVKAMAQTAWGEARGEGIQGMLAVMWVILNRCDDPRWPDSPYDVAHQPWQFSVWNPGDPNRERMEQVTENDCGYNAALGLARALLEGFDDEDPTHGADHYFANYIETPWWVEDMVHTTTIGVHNFYKDI